MENYLIDNLDQDILETLMSNMRTTHAELTRQFGVSPGAIHVQVEKMKQAGIIIRAHIDVSPKQLGYNIGCFIGITLKSIKDYSSALAELESLDEATEAYYVTGHCSIFIKVMCCSIDAPQHVFTNKIRTIDEIQSTETLVVLQNPIMRTIKPRSAFLIPYFPTGRSQRAYSVQYATPNKGGGL